MKYIENILNEVKNYYTNMVVESREILDEDNYTYVGRLVTTRGKTRSYVGASYRPYWDSFPYDIKYFADKECTQKSFIEPYERRDLKIVIDSEFKDTDIWIQYMPDDEENSKKHEQFLKDLDIVDGYVILKHSSSTYIKGCINSKGKPKNSYSLNSDVNGTYYWASPDFGKDPSNGGCYTYYCKVPLEDVYDMTSNIEGFPSISEAMKHKKVVALYWNGGPAIVAVTRYALKYFQMDGGY